MHNKVVISRVVAEEITAFWLLPDRLTGKILAFISNLTFINKNISNYIKNILFQI